MTTASGLAPDVEAAIDALYAGALDEFVAARGELVKTLRAAGDKSSAARVKAVAKPSLSAWTVNQLWWHEREIFDALLDAGDLVRRAQAEGGGPSAQATAAKRRRACLDRLLGAAEQLLARGGHAASAATLRRVATTLDAAAAYGRAPIDPAPGRLWGDLEPPGFEVLAGHVSPVQGVQVIDASAWTEPATEAHAARDGSHAREAARALAQVAVAEAARDVDATTRALDDASLAAQAAEDALQSARARAARATAEAEEAELVFRRAAKAADAREGEARAALERLHAATRRLAAAGD